MPRFIFSQSDSMPVWEEYTQPTEGLDSVNETVLSLYLHCTTAPIWCHYKQLSRLDPHTERVVTSQQFQSLFLCLVAKMKALQLHIYKGSCLNWSRAEGRKIKEHNRLSAELISVWTLMYKVQERFLKCKSNMQNCNSNSDGESAWWVTTQKNNLERYIAYISSFFSSDTGITFALQFIGFTHKSSWQNKSYGPVYVRTVSLRQQAVTSQVIPCRL